MWPRQAEPLRASCKLLHLWPSALHLQQGEEAGILAQDINGCGSWQTLYWLEYCGYLKKKAEAASCTDQYFSKLNIWLMASKHLEKSSENSILLRATRKDTSGTSLFQGQLAQLHCNGLTTETWHSSPCGRDSCLVQSPTDLKESLPTQNP